MTACDANRVSAVSLMLDVDETPDHSLVTSVNKREWDSYSGEVYTVLSEHEKKHKDIKALAKMREFLDRRRG